MLTLKIKKLHFPNNSPIQESITVNIYIKPYYSPDSAYTLVQGNVPVLIDGTIQASPLPATSIDPTQKYVLKIVNGDCSYEYTQDVIVYPYCQEGYTLSDDSSTCTLMQEVAATPPSNSQNAVSVTGPNNFYYGIFGTLIFNAGYNVDGTGPFTRIPYTNPFWVNGTGYPTYPSASNTAGPLDRSGVWSPTVSNPQTVGFSVCINTPTDGVYHIGFGCDDFGQINVDGTTVVKQVKANLISYLASNGYPYPFGLDPSQVCFNFWFIYPVFLTAGTHVVEVIGNNVSGSVPGAACIGCEVYNMTAASISAVTSYAAMGSGLVFSSKDYVGMPIQLGSGGVGYSCPIGFSLKYCDSPPSCVKILTSPVLY